ncbi:MAG: energy-coupling factor ABC transporter ATP-binding protein [Anaerolineales bacterium]
MHHKVEIRNLSYRYPDGRLALDRIDLVIEPGERVALVGPNGAGKSTLLLQLNGTLQPEGSIEVCGIPVAPDRLGEVRAAVGLVFQDPDDQLFTASVYDDVAFGPIYAGMDHKVVQQRVEQALAAVGMEGANRRVPHNLSAGEKKRVAIATVLAMDPEVLALDEPTAGLDPRGRRELMQLLTDLPQTMVVATHDMRLVQEMLPRTVILDEGKIQAAGPTQQIMADKELLERHGLEQP